MKLFAAATLLLPLLYSGTAMAAVPDEEQARIACQLGGKCASEPADVADPAADGSMAVGDERGFDMFRKGGAPATASPAVFTAPGARRGPNLASVGSASAHRQRVTRVSFNQPGGQIVERPRGTADMALRFENGSADLSGEAKARIATFAKVLMDPSHQLSDARFTIEGHTNAVGGRDYNLDLSRRRAQAVVDYLVTLGVARDRLTSEGLGFDRPLPGTASADANNRRVEIVKAS